MNLKNLQLDIENATKKAFDEIRKHYPDQKFCGFALYSDPDASTICPAVNSLQNFENMISSDPDDKEYYKWSPGEWDHEFVGAEYFNEICQHIAHIKNGNLSIDARREINDEIYEICVAALENMLHQGYFSGNDIPFVLVFTIADGGNEKEKDWICRLNNEIMSSEFIQWLESLE